jgi:two-component system nitrate/nitrite response regulator NarL
MIDERWQAMRLQTTALVAESHPGFRRLLVRVLKRDLDVRVAHLPRTASDAFGLILTTRPDIAIIDRDLPGQDSLRALPTIRQGAPRTRVVLTASDLSHADIIRARHAGAWGHLVKSASRSEVLAVLKALLAEDSVLTGDEDAGNAQAGADVNPSAERKGRIATLTRREMEVLTCVGRGMSTKEIAAAIDLSVKTIDRYQSRLMAKLNIRDRVQLSLCAIREGMVPPHSDERSR